jgi:hypothetical protein
MSNASGCTPASVAKRLACLSCDEVAAVLAAAGLSPKVLMAIELASIAAAESANKRRLTAADVRNDALGRMGTIRTLVELLLGRHKGALVCRRWRDATRGLALTEGEEDSLVRAVAADHTNPHLLANLRYHDVTVVDLGPRYEWKDPVTALLIRNDDDVPVINDAVVVALAKGCRHLINIKIHSRYVGITDAAVAALATGCRKLTDIDLSETRITDAAATALAAGCLKLTNIDLSGCAITDAAVVALATGCPNLIAINLSSCQHITGAAFTALTTGCPKLRAIFLDYCTHFNDVGAQALAGLCRNLTEVHLSGTQVTDVGAQALAGLCPNLTTIRLSNTQVTDVGTQALAVSCPNLTTIWLDFTQVTDMGALELAVSCPNLTTINLVSTQVTDVGAMVLADSCRNLAMIHLYNTQVSDAGKQQIENWLAEKNGGAPKLINDVSERSHLTIYVSERRQADVYRS